MEKLELEQERSKQPKAQAHGNEEPTGCSFEGALTFGIGLFAGTFSALLCKMAYDTTSHGLDGQEKQFAKPIMMLFLMFAGMLPANLFYFIQQRLFTKPEDRDVVPWSTFMILIVPCLCDLMCTLLLLVAQLYITASLWQMMRGTVIIITAVLKSQVLGINLRRHMWAGVFVITLAMLLVASTSFFAADPDGPSAAGPSSDKDPRIGILLVVCGCLAQGVQYVFEEKVMAVGAPPLVVIGAEGLWGSVLSLLVIFPLAHFAFGGDDCGGGATGCYENPWDSLAMIQNNPMLSRLIIGFVMTVTVYNCMVIYVTKYLSSIWHAILDNFRPITIWGLDLALFYSIMPGQGFGEQWLGMASWVQLAGLMVLFLGTAIYNGTLGMCGEVDAGYMQIGEEEEGPDASGLIQTPVAMASPSLTRSPLIYRPAHHPHPHHEQHNVHAPGSSGSGGQSYHNSNV